MVYYVISSPKDKESWPRLSHALEDAAEARLPTLVLLEDLEQFLSDASEMQNILNTLDGLATPDNPAGTLLLATTNAPDKIDDRIMKRPGRMDVLVEVGAIESEDIARRFLMRYLGPSYSDALNGFLPEIMGQTGTHVQQAALMAAMRALEEERMDIRLEDLTWAHQVLLEGRQAAGDLKSCEVPTGLREPAFFHSRKKEK